MSIYRGATEELRKCDIGLYDYGKVRAIKQEQRGAREAGFFLGGGLRIYVSNCK